jgi:hypothetical protein
VSIKWDEQLDWCADGTIWIARHHDWEIRQAGPHFFEIWSPFATRPRKYCASLAEAKRFVSRAIKG